MIDWMNFLQRDLHVDNAMISVMRNEINYWTEVLKRVIAVIIYLAERGLAFRGTDEKIGSPSNDNFLGILELINQFDPFLKNHIDTYANKGKGNVSYLSKTIYEKFITLIGERILHHIIDEIKAAKYWGLVVDSTPDITHVDQLSIIFRYYLNGSIHERFFCFLPIKSHTGKSLSCEIFELLKNNDINIADCRAQTYDNAANMSGKYSGLQAWIKEQNNLAFYVPCIGHSLNLVGESSVNECLHSVNFFGLLQRLYLFFTASTHRWNILSLEQSKLSSLSATRWSARADASRDYVKNFDGIHNALTILTEDKEQKLDTRNEAESLLKNIVKYENAFMAILWNRILHKFNIVNTYLQKVDLDLDVACNMLISLIDFVKNLREKFCEIELEAKQLSCLINQNYTRAEKRIITKKLSSGETQVVDQNSSDVFRVHTFYVIIDKLYAELEKRHKAYKYVINIFGFLTKLLVMDENEACLKAKNLVDVYSEDLEMNLLDELEQFVPLLKKQPIGFFSNYEHNDNTLYSLNVLNWMIESKLIDIFPNIYISYRLFVTIPIANTESERSFSVLKRIKNMYRSLMSQDRLAALSIMCIEKDLLRSLDFSDIINEFAQKKARKQNF